LRPVPPVAQGTVKVCERDENAVQVAPNCLSDGLNGRWQAIPIEQRDIARYGIQWLAEYVDEHADFG